MAARVSIRVSIAWSGQPAIEDTDTLVLTIDGYSLDLRVFNTGPDKGTIDWSTVARVGEIEGSTKENPKLRWDHIIDSRPPTSMPDQGVFDTLPNGDVTETGTMHNPKTDQYEPYVETWRRLKVGDNVPYLVLERLSPKTSPSNGGHGEEGVFIGRVGGYALGLAKVQGAYYAYRDSLSGGKWERVYKFSDGKEDLQTLIPALPVEIPSDWTKGATVRLGDAEWIVRTVGTV
ncbi:hypothetical protein IAU59_006290 [Kwoniella sp. CBS 9459]